MSVFEAMLIGLTMGIVFGFALEKSRVFEPGMIVGQMQLRNFIMLKVFLTAIATGAVVLAALHGFGLVKLHPKGAHLRCRYRRRAAAGRRHRARRGLPGHRPRPGRRGLPRRAVHGRGRNRRRGRFRICRTGPPGTALGTRHGQDHLRRCRRTALLAAGAGPGGDPRGGPLPARGLAPVAWRAGQRRRRGRPHRPRPGHTAAAPHPINRKPEGASP